jgi:polyhydroxyalkanoate synthesis regulator phasin
MTENDIGKGEKAQRRRPLTIEGSADCAAPSAPPPPDTRRRVGRLEHLADWRRQIAKVYRAVRKGDMPSSEGTRLVFILQAGAQITREESRERHEAEQRAQIERLQEQLAELQGKRSRAALPAPTPSTPALPAWAQEPAPAAQPKEPKP